MTGQTRTLSQTDTDYGAGRADAVSNVGKQTQSDKVLSPTPPKDIAVGKKSNPVESSVLKSSVTPGVKQVNAETGVTPIDFMDAEDSPEKSEPEGPVIECRIMSTSGISTQAARVSIKPQEAKEEKLPHQQRDYQVDIHSHTVREAANGAVAQQMNSFQNMLIPVSFPLFPAKTTTSPSKRQRSKDSQDERLDGATLAERETIY